MIKAKKIKNGDPKIKTVNENGEVCEYTYDKVDEIKTKVVVNGDKKLKEKYPEVKFIVINIDDFGQDRPKASLKENRFKFKDEYQFKNPKESIEALAIQPMTKTIVIDKNKKIVYNNANIFSGNFEEQLLGAINRK